MRLLYILERTMKNTTKIKTYTELCQLKTFEERLRYLAIGDGIGEETFGSRRYLNQEFYRSGFWRRIRNHVIFRDDGCDLGICTEPIYTRPLIHHMNPITIDDILNKSPLAIDEEYLITVSFDTHNAIHYGDVDGYLFGRIPAERSPNDTCPWK